MCGENGSTSKRGVPNDFAWSLKFPFRKREMESCSLVYFAFSPYAPAVAVDDTLHKGEPDARSLELLG